MFNRVLFDNVTGLAVYMPTDYWVVHIRRPKAGYWRIKLQWASDKLTGFPPPSVVCLACSSCTCYYEGEFGL